jgi:hypothetical protein
MKCLYIGLAVDHHPLGTIRGDPLALGPGSDSIVWRQGHCLILKVALSEYMWQFLSHYTAM